MIFLAKAEEEEISEVEEEESSEREESEEEFGEFTFTSLEDIELLVKNTEVWDNLLNGKISIEEAKKAFEENFNSIITIESKKIKSKRKSVRAKKEIKEGKEKKRKKSKKVKEESSESE